jgi:glycosyltransferase involved in cell wall biosynthesis
MTSEKNLRIGIPINTFVLGHGLPGIDKYTYNLILALLNLEGVEVLVFQEKYRKNGPFDRFEICYFPILRELLSLKRVATPDRTPESSTRMSNGKRKVSNFGRIRREIVKSIYYLSKGVDVIHYPTHMESPLPLTFSRTVLTLYDLVPMVHPETSTRDIIDNFNRCVRGLHYVDAFVTISEFSKREMVDKLDIEPDKISVCYPGVDQSFFISKTRDEVVRKYSKGFPYILFVGTLEPRKNVERLIEAYHELGVHDLKLLLVGKEGWGAENIRKKIEVLGIDQHVIFPGYVPEEDLPHLYRGAELFVYPSFYEGFGMPVVEAMAAGAPVITSKTSSLAEVAGDSAVLISPQDTRELVEAVRGTLGNSELRDELRSKGVNRAKDFTWENCARGVLDVYYGDRGR